MLYLLVELKKKMFYTFERRFLKKVVLSAVLLWALGC